MMYVAAEQSVAAAAGHAAAHAATCGIVAVCVTARSTVSVSMHKQGKAPPAPGGSKAPLPPGGSKAPLPPRWK